MPQVREAPDGAGVLLVTGSGVHELAGSAFRPVWQPPEGEIGIHGVVDVPGWRGTLFFTDAAAGPYLLTRCEG